MCNLPWPAWLQRRINSEVNLGIPAEIVCPWTKKMRIGYGDNSLFQYSDNLIPLITRDTRAVSTIAV